MRHENLSDGPAFAECASAGKGDGLHGRHGLHGKDRAGRFPEAVVFGRAVKILGWRDSRKAALLVLGELDPEEEAAIREEAIENLMGEEETSHATVEG